MEKSKAERLVQEILTEAIKAGVLLPITAGEKQGEDAANFIISAHKKLMEYYETLE